MYRKPLLSTILRPTLAIGILLLLVLRLHHTTAANATTIRQVPAQYPTIAQALAVAQPGDTVHVAPGLYTEGMLQLLANVTLLGSGWAETIIDGNGSNVVLYPAPGSRVEGFTIRGSADGGFDAGIWISAGTVTLAANRLTANATGLWAWCFEPERCNIQITLERNIIDRNRTNGVNSNELARFTVRNNTITQNGEAGLILQHGASLAEQNLITDNGGVGLRNDGGATLHHNNLWGNQRNYVGGSNGAAGLSVDPLFRNATQGDYRLYGGSPAIGNDPAAATLGALPFTPVGQPPAQVTLVAIDATTWQVNWIERAAAGYLLYYGPCTRQTTTVVPVGNVLTYQISGVTAADVGYVAVSAQASNGDESAVQSAAGVGGVCPTAPVALQVGAFPQGQLRLQWQNTTTNEENLQVERAEGVRNTIDAASFTLIATLAAGSSVYTDTPPLLDATYWYRVRAVNANGPSPYSNQSYSATFAQVPNHDERYLLVLINEARAAPGTFGYGEIAPVPPLAYNPLLHYAAHAHSQAILNSGFLIGHCDAIGRCPGERAAAVGYRGGGAENLVQGQTGPASVEGANQAFMDSEGHRKNMLCPCAVEVGLGHTYDPAKGGDSYWKGQYTEQFAAQPNFVLPHLPSGIAIPYTGTLATAFTFIANYYHPAGTPPDQALVLIDDLPYAMSLSTGNPANGTYRFVTQLAPGDHRYAFSFTFAGGSARLPANADYTLPVTGPTTSAPGDGNSDGHVDTADLPACIAEIFDGDGTNPADAYHGTLAGSAACDANADGTIGAGDLSCLVQLLVNGPGTCENGTMAAAAQPVAAQPVALTIEPAIPAADGTLVVPINLAGHGHAISATTFALRPGPGFDPSDHNGDGLPDAIQLAPAAGGLTVTLHWQAGRLDVALIDASTPITPLPDGTLLTVSLRDVTSASVAFDYALLPSLGSPTGGNVPVQRPAPVAQVYLPLVVR